MLATLGDLVDDIVVVPQGPIQWASDTEAQIRRRPGGSAANVAVGAARLGVPSRFLGQIGNDTRGDALLGQLASVGVDMSAVRRSGVTGTVLVIVDADGERSMLTDRRTCIELADPVESWLDSVSMLHVPFYSFVHRPLSESAERLIEWSHRRDTAVSIDVSSVALLESYGIAEVKRLLDRLAPDLVFANENEAAAMRVNSAIGGALTVVKRGPEPALIHCPGTDVEEVPAISLSTMVDSTGAGDAFAAGFLSHRNTEGDLLGWRDDPVAACRAGHRLAADLLSSRTLAG